MRGIETFKKIAFVDSDGITICWPNGADLSPDILYEMGAEVKKSVKKSVPKKKVLPLRSSCKVAKTKH